MIHRKWSSERRRYSLAATVLLFCLFCLQPLVNAKERGNSLLRGKKSSSKSANDSILHKRVLKGDVKDGDKTTGGMKMQARKSEAVKASQGSLGRVKTKVQKGNEEELKKEAEVELKAQLMTYFGGHGQEEIEAKTADFDSHGDLHLRIKQKIHGLEVEGAALVVHVGSNGTLTAINGELLDDELPVGELDPFNSTYEASALLQMALEEAGVEEGEWVGEPERAVVRRSDNGKTCIAWKQTVKYNVTGETKGYGPQMDWIYADATYSGDDSTADVFSNLFQDDPDAAKFLRQNKVLCARHPQFMGAGAPIMRTYDCRQQTSGCILRSQSSTVINTPDAALDAAHNYAIATYNYFYNNFGRDSLDGKGMPIRSRVHFSSQYNNAFWDGYQMTYGDGDGQIFRPLSMACDVVAHELTHGVTASTSDLVYQGESGALNEAISDIFGALVDRQEGATGMDIWLIGEDIYTPGTPGDAIRNMADPEAMGDYDFYPTRYTGPGDNGGVHVNSGVVNLAFKLLVTGGTHPRGKTSVVVQGIGFDAAAAIFYWANVNCLTPGATFEMARFCTAETYGGQYKANVHQAWDAVGVPGGAPVPPPGPIILQDGEALGGQRSSESLQYRLGPIYTNDSVTCTTTCNNGDADLYIRFGSEPGVWPNHWENDCWSYSMDSNEQCSTAGASGETTTAFIVVHAYYSFTDLTIECLIERAVQPPVEPQSTVDSTTSSSPSTVAPTSSSPSTIPPTVSPTVSTSPSTSASPSHPTTFPSASPSTTPSVSPSTSPSALPSTSAVPTTTMAPSSSAAPTSSTSTSTSSTTTPSSSSSTPPTTTTSSTSSTLPPLLPLPSLPASLGCFAGTTGVHVLEKGIIAMKDLVIGDLVLTAASLSSTSSWSSTSPPSSVLSYEPVYGFGHYHADLVTEFVQLYYDVVVVGGVASGGGGGNGINSTFQWQSSSSFYSSPPSSPLELTGNHLLFVVGRSHPIRADAVQVNDKLVPFSNFEFHHDVELHVTRIDRVVRPGVFAPLTPSGTIVVFGSVNDNDNHNQQCTITNNNTTSVGMVASTYISVQEHAAARVGICATGPHHETRTDLALVTATSVVSLVDDAVSYEVSCSDIKEWSRSSRRVQRRRSLVVGPMGQRRGRLGGRTTVGRPSARVGPDCDHVGNAGGGGTPSSSVAVSWCNNVVVGVHDDVVGKASDDSFETHPPNEKKVQTQRDAM